MKRRIHNILYGLGFQLRRIGEISSFEFQRNRLLLINDVDICIDCGANVGAYARSLRDAGYRGAVISIEPSLAAYMKLRRNCANDKKWQAYHYAVGDFCGIVQLNVTENSVSSSLLSPKPTQFNAKVGATVASVETVTVTRIDRFVQTNLSTFKKIFLKFDVQGYELIALNGATSILDRVCLIELEMSLSTLYEGAVDWLVITNQLRSLGYELIAVQQNTVDKTTARTLEINGIFSKGD